MASRAALAVGCPKAAGAASRRLGRVPCRLSQAASTCPLPGLWSRDRTNLQAYPAGRSWGASVNIHVATATSTVCASSTNGTKSTAKDTILRTVSWMGELTVFMLDGTQLVQEALDRHKCAPAAAVALGRGLLGTLLIGAFKKDGEATQTVFKGTGELGQMICVANSEGQVKGLVENPNAHAVKADGSVDIPSIVGSGFLSVVRSHPFWKEPYTGTVPISTGEIAQDLAQYLLDSEQQQCALAAGVSLNLDGTVAAAGGFLIRALPLISDESVEILERNIMELPSVTSLLIQGKTPAEITNMILRDIEASPGADEIVPTYGPCDEEDLTERMRRAVAALGEEESMAIIDEQGAIELTCDFCKFSKSFSREDVLATLEGAKTG